MLAGTLLALTIAAGAVVVQQQLVVFRLEQEARGTSGAKVPIDATGLRRWCLDGCGVRGGLAAAAVTAAAGGRAATLSARSVLETQAHVDLVGVLARQPSSAAALVQMAGVDLQVAGRVTPEVRRLLARSYAEAPFLHEQGAWRVEVLADDWPHLVPGLRRRVLDEAEWLLSTDAADQAGVVAALGRTARTAPG